MKFRKFERSHVEIFVLTILPVMVLETYLYMRVFEIKKKSSHLNVRIYMTSPNKTRNKLLNNCYFFNMPKYGKFF